MSSVDRILTTPLHQMHLEADAKMVPFAGYEMPLQYPLGIKKEHLHTRENAGLFDVSHMGQMPLQYPLGIKKEHLHTRENAGL